MGWKTTVCPLIDLRIYGSLKKQLQMDKTYPPHKILHIYGTVEGLYRG